MTTTTIARWMGVALAALLVGGCGGAGAAAPPVPATVDGEALFTARALGATPGCVTCHSLTPGHVLVGPSLGDLSDRHADLPDAELAEHVRSSIVSPDSNASSRSSTPMPAGYGNLLSEEQIDAVVAYVLAVSS